VNDEPGFWDFSRREKSQKPESCVCEAHAKLSYRTDVGKAPASPTGSGGLQSSITKLELDNENEGETRENIQKKSYFYQKSFNALSDKDC
jgi:hypothetical protein